MTYRVPDDLCARCGGFDRKEGKEVRCERSSQEQPAYLELRVGSCQPRSQCHVDGTGRAVMAGGHGLFGTWTPGGLGSRGLPDHQEATAASVQGRARAGQPEAGSRSKASKRRTRWRAGEGQLVRAWGPPAASAGPILKEQQGQKLPARSAQHPALGSRAGRWGRPLKH